MAGIGFELKKIFKEESLGSMIAGAGYSTVVTIGPTIIIMAVIILLYIILDLFSISYAERELLSSTILYSFIFSVILTAPFNAIASRYIADKIYYEKYEDILPSFYSGLAVSIVIGSLISIPLLLHAWIVGGVPFVFVWFSYGMFSSLIIVFYASNYLVATKEYKIITIYFLIGMALAFCLALFLNYVVKVKTIESILYGVTIGFLVIACLSFAYIRKYFHVCTKNYKEYFIYCKKHWNIFLTNLFYMLGLYIHNFILWNTENRIVVADTYISAPSYDMASCLAMFSNISMMVIFTVMAETKFHDIYQLYNESVIGSTYAQIKLNRRRMFRLLIQQLSYLIMIQAVISILLFLVVNAFLPQMGFNGLTISIYPLLSAAYFALFSTYCSIIFLYYFDDNTGSLITTIIFAVMVFVGTMLSRNLSPELYGLGPLLGGLCGWTCSYFRIRYLEKHFDKHIFCNINIVKNNKEVEPDNIVYQAGKQSERVKNK